MVAAGLISRNAALTELKPSIIPDAVVRDLSLADPRMTLERCATLSWESPHPHYYMFGRKIDAWVTSKDVAALIA